MRELECGPMPNVMAAQPNTIWISTYERPSKDNTLQVGLGHGDQQQRKQERNVKTGNEQMCNKTNAH